MIKLAKIVKEIMDVQPPAIVQQQPNTQTNVVNQQAITNSYILATTLWGEARGEDERGMQAVLNVIMNRAGGKFDKATKIALSPSQFSFWNNITNKSQYAATTAEKARDGSLQDSSKFTSALQLVEKARTGTLSDVTGGALYYFNPNKVNPSWAKKMTKTATIGNHDFYKVGKIKSNLSQRVAASIKNGLITKDEFDKNNQK